jgi:hypothetical protein
MADDIREALVSQKIEIEKLFGDILATHAIITNVFGHLALVDLVLPALFAEALTMRRASLRTSRSSKANRRRPITRSKLSILSRACAPQRSAIKTSRNTSFSWLGFTRNTPPRSTIPTTAIAPGFAA